jgi:acetyl esterase/lipase
MKHRDHSIAVISLFVASLTLFAQNAPPVPPGVQAHRDLPYVEHGHEQQKFDLYLPEKTASPLPVIIWVHGGAWQAGSKNGCPAIHYVQQGYAVASVEYRFSQHAIFPAQIEDCKAAIRWLRAHAKEYALDPKRFGVWGGSAGGHLVALLGTSGDVKDFDVGANLDQSSRVQAVCDYYGPTDFTVFVTTPGYENHATDSSPEAKLLGGIVAQNKTKADRANPITYVSHDNPPFLIVHGDKDPTVPINQSQLLFDALKKAGVSAHFHTIHGAGHGGTGFNGRDINEMVTAFFEERLKSSSAKIDALSTESTADPAAMARDPRANAPAGQRRGIPWEVILNRDDKNKDGKISREEFSGPPQLFDRLDRNHDGFITRDEHEAFQQATTSSSSSPQ